MRLIILLLATATMWVQAINIACAQSAGTAPSQPVSTTIYFDETDERIERILATRDTWNFGTAPVGKVLDVIHQRFEIPVRIDKIALNDEGVDREILIEWQPGELRLETVFKEGLQQVALDWVVNDGVLTITTQATCREGPLHARLYPIADLTRRKHREDDAVGIVLMMQQTADAQWEEIDGVGGTAVYIPFAEGILVRQTREAHRDIERALAMLRKGKATQGDARKERAKPLKKATHGSNAAPRGVRPASSAAPTP